MMTIQQLAQLAERCRPKGPVPTWLKCGAGVMDALREISVTPKAVGGFLGCALFGITVLECDELAPGEWRLFDSDWGLLDNGELPTFEEILREWVWE